MHHPLAYQLPDFLKIAGIGRTKAYEEIRAGRLKARKSGNRTIVLAADAQAYLDSLPTFSPRSAA
ncbi:MAG TPA: DNA-binding protein [Devosia sp.]|jgi:hypothetical protein|uniref:DNA-binding protein n=1 Tax=Devosia sp. TaxID=1871048 RepID=UPI002DDCFC03|nr:DNA-binding protein [Devosia sp.]HEV2517904.1 DNA-binding protein [Devosia sp.]